MIYYYPSLSDCDVESILRSNPRNSVHYDVARSMYRVFTADGHDKTYMVANSADGPSAAGSMAEMDFWVKILRHELETHTESAWKTLLSESKCNVRMRQVLSDTDGNLLNNENDLGVFAPFSLLDAEPDEGNGDTGAISKFLFQGLTVAVPVDTNLQIHDSVSIETLQDYGKLLHNGINPSTALDVSGMTDVASAAAETIVRRIAHAAVQRASSIDLGVTLSPRIPFGEECTGLVLGVAASPVRYLFTKDLDLGMFNVCISLWYGVDILDRASFLKDADDRTDASVVFIRGGAKGKNPR